MVIFQAPIKPSGTPEPGSAPRFRPLSNSWFMSGGGNLLPKFMPVLFSGTYLAFQANLVFRRVSPCSGVAGKRMNLRTCWQHPFSFTGAHLVVGAFQTQKVAHLDWCLPCSHKNAVAHMLLHRPCRTNHKPTQQRKLQVVAQL